MSNTALSPEEEISLYGFTPVSSSPSTLLSSNPTTTHPPYIPITSTPIPSTPLAKRINEYAKSKLPPQTYNHSLRVYHYGLAIKLYRFPHWTFTDETYFLACLLHDIGTTDENLQSTRLSFEFYGGIIALKVLGDDATEIAPQAQADSVAEAIMRHQDLCEKGKITALGQLLQLATIFDNTGNHAALIHPSTIDDVTTHYPRNKWSGCFAATIRKECDLKPWAHTTTLGEEEFPAKVLGNTLMEPYE